jgi:hypothetical protein
MDFRNSSCGFLRRHQQPITCLLFGAPYWLATGWDRLAFEWPRTLSVLPSALNGTLPSHTFAAFALASALLPFF